jgi:hypothetical protein
MSNRTTLFVLAVAAVMIFGGDGVLAQSLYTVPPGIDARWASPENPRGEKGRAAETNGGRKGRPAIPMKAGEQVTLAEVQGPVEPSAGSRQR